MTPFARYVRATLVVVLVVGLAACGTPDDATSDSDTSGELPTTGYRRDPAPDVSDFALPDLSNDGSPYALRAEPDGLLVVYFGYTNCPDFCPTTLSDLRIAQNRIAAERPELGDRIAEAMITVDPDRDVPVLADYVESFFEDGHALGSDDPKVLAQVAEPFGVGYAVTPADESESGDREVAHTTSLYAVDD
ncbi:MAG TPA: SCO family protein, partial [Ilumatobacter sp.]|nr:SCO family protein [Ilumatobacter sp.]